MGATSSEPFVKQIVRPAGAQHGSPVWVYRYDEPERSWRLSIATHAEPGSNKLSLGGFRIAPPDRIAARDYDNDREAVNLAVGMEEKIRWSRLTGVGGPLGRRDVARTVGGKCVLRPTPDARVGNPRDADLLDFAISCFRDFEASAAVRLVTGQDLGHGLMSDGVTSSLRYLNEQFRGSVVADTSEPTAAGNFHILRGMLRAHRIGLPGARVGLIGCGNVGMHLLRRLLNEGAEAVALEASPSRQEELAALGVHTYTPLEKRRFLQEPLDAVAVNAGGGSLDIAAARAIATNPRLRVVCGCENLAMPDASAAELLRNAETVYCPTELGGMMGYLTAAEEYLSGAAGVPFEMETMLDAAGRLEVTGFEATEAVIGSSYELSFAAAVERLNRVV